jgi:hypothetical protein
MLHKKYLLCRTIEIDQIDLRHGTSIDTRRR